MDNNPDVRLSGDGKTVTRAYLESLTTLELLKMADSRGVDIPSDLDRIFVIEELLEFNSPDSDGGGESETDMLDSARAESVPLPKQYNITFIEVMIRDPLWAFVFWEIKGQDKELFEKSQDFEGYYLKVVPFEEPGCRPPGESPEVFTVPVDPSDSAWYLSLSPEAVEPGSSPVQSRFMCELCVSLGGEETVLASSKPVILPGLPGSAGAGSGENGLNRLSGSGDFHILRSNERKSRAKTGNSGLHE